MFDFLFGKTGDQINKEYDKALKNAGEERSKAVFDAVYNNDLYNANKDKFNAMGVERPNYASEVSSAYAKDMNSLQKEADIARRQNKYNVFGNGMIGSILNPVVQVGSVAGDMLAAPFRAMAGEETNRYLRDPENDFLSDIGAIGETAIDLASMGTLGSAAKGGTKLMSNFGKTALKTGGLGAAENAMSTLREQGSNVDFGDLARNAAIGGIVGGTIGGITQIGGNAANMAKKVRSPQGQLLGDLYKQAKAGNSITPPVSPSRALGDGVNGASIGTKGNFASSLNLTPGQEALALRTSTPLAKTGIGRVVQGIGDYGTLYGNPLSKIANSRVGNTARNILKTKTGKIGAGIGGGILLNKLLSGGNNQSSDAGLTDAEMEQLLNYYNNGGY